MRRGTLAAASAAAFAVALAVTVAISFGEDGDSAGSAADRRRAAGSAVPGRRAPMASAQSFSLRAVARGLVRPTSVAAAPGDPDALWVTEQTGRLVRVAGGRRTTALDLRERVRVGGEQGLLAVAFHPDFARNRRLVVDFTDRRGDTRVVEYRLGSGWRADRRSARVLLSVDQPYSNHNGGALLFATDGRLLVGMGDGGGAFDPGDRAQRARSPHGKLLAGSVDDGEPVRWRPVLSGLRNPWRVWIDPALSELWIGDVGQDRAEEVNRVFYEPDEPPKNLGWPAWEGDRLLDRARIARAARPVRPVAVYGHDEGCSITGGLIYRGRRVDALRERYVYGDFCTGTIWSMRPPGKGLPPDIRRERAHVPQLTAIAADGAGELVFAAASGEIFRATEPPPFGRRD
jgi:glucose/arabinose dehydrogenase